MDGNQRVNDTWLDVPLDAGNRTQIGRRCEAAGADGTRVLLIDDHAILRAGVGALINREADLKVAGQAASIAEALENAQALDFDLIVADFLLAAGCGRQDIVELRSRWPEARLLAFTVHDDAESIRAAFAAGADGYVLKDATHAEFIGAVRAVLAGQRHLCSRSMAHVVCGYLGEPQPAQPVATGVTGREREILTMMATGQSNKQMAMALNRSIKTIEKHRANLMRKLGFGNLADVTRFALETGILRS
jgi:DNA-binding NarL/FixJ family response regulator